MQNIAEIYASKIWDEKDLTAIDQFIHTQCIIHSLLGNYQGRSAMKNVVQSWLSAFPDLKVDPVSVLRDQDKTVIQWTAKGTHQGDFKGIEPTQKRISYAGVTIYRIQAHQIIEYWAYLDLNHILNQLLNNGVVEENH